MRLVYTAGVWDILHRGHLNFLWECSRLGDVLVVGVVSDKGTHDYKGFFPHENARLRAEKVGRIPFVTTVVPQLGTDPTQNLERFRPDVFAHADGDGDWSLLRERVAALGIAYVDIGYTSGISSSQLRAERADT